MIAKQKKKIKKKAGSNDMCLKPSTFEQFERPTGGTGQEIAATHPPPHCPTDATCPWLHGLHRKLPRFDDRGWVQ